MISHPTRPATLTRLLGLRSAAQPEREAYLFLSDAGEEAAQESTSPWWWALAVGALVVVIGGLVLLVRGRRDSEDETPRG